ncbi:MAG: hypothetical protein GQ565_03100 [Candidatus Aegiribacteria sp.]|nr:hypothetical protein [Candidatus Aegiribacteria sp.]
MAKEQTVQLRLTKKELSLLVNAFGEVNVAVKHIEEYVLPLLAKLETVANKFEGE